MTAEGDRLDAAAAAGGPGWRHWGPYLSERQWGTVREDYSSDGEAWSYFTHDQARSRAYRWGEDGIAGVSDDQQLLCFALAMWNGRDPILKERMFGLTNAEGNHGEDSKDYWFYLDSTPTHSFMRYLYKYPQREFPYADLVAGNASRGRADFEYELLDTGVFDEDRYFDVEVEYAKATPEDLLISIRVHNRGPDTATLDLLPTLWFRHTWSWAGGSEVPELRQLSRSEDLSTVAASATALGPRWLHCDGGPALLFTGNETNNERIFGAANDTPYVKDGIGRFVVNGEAGAIDPTLRGTKVAAHYPLTLEPGASATVRLRLTDVEPVGGSRAVHERYFADFDDTVATRRHEADEFYASVIAPGLDDDTRAVARQAYAGMLWSKQYYGLDVERWLIEHGQDPISGEPDHLRNSEWFHLVNRDVLSMPDKWEYPWYASWDLAFHAFAFTPIDIAFAKQQLSLLLDRRFQHPNGQIPAYEWNFSDVNPPVQPWATIFVYELEKLRTGTGDRAFLEDSFLKLLRNFTWWVNRKDVEGRNLFQGGFLGLDNIGVFDRSAPLPTGGHLDQADGTAWMALFCQTMLRIAIELAEEDPTYLEQAQVLFEHFAWIAVAMSRLGGGDTGLWDEEDGFFYDVLRLPDGSTVPLKVRSAVGLIPLAAATVLGGKVIGRFPQLLRGAREFVESHPSVLTTVTAREQPSGAGGQVLMSLFGEPRLRRILARMLDEEEFLGPYGIRSLSKYHEQHPYSFWAGDQEYRVSYNPAESDSGMFGGNSNWRGPVWFPINALMIRALMNLYMFYGPDFTVECPTGSGRLMNLFEVAREISDRSMATFLRRPDGRRPVYGGTEKFQTDPHWRDLIEFHEYFHADNGAGLGASHQTGWTGVVAAFVQLFGTVDAATMEAFYRDQKIEVPANARRVRA